MYQNNPYYQNYNMPQYQMNNHIDQNQMYAGGAQPFLKGKSVISIDEARAAMFSYNVELSYEQEELLADLLATYGEEIIDITDSLFDRLKERH